MNPYLDNQLKGFSKGNNKINAQAHVSILSAGFKKFGGYNTIELNVRGMAYGKIPYELFELATNTSNKNYQIGDVAFMAQSFAELAIGHSRQINERLRLGAKAKITIELHPVSQVHVNFAFVICPRHTERDDSLWFYNALNKLCFLEFWVLVIHVLD